MGFSRRSYYHHSVEPFKGCDSPSVKVPASPLLTRLGYGTGVNVYLMKRGPKEGLPRSPWAVKRLNQFGKKMKSQIMERMKTEIEILRNFKHPNIIAFRYVLVEVTFR